MSDDDPPRAMVRVNLIDPRALADQHLIAEYNEILMLFGHVRRHPVRGAIPPTYRLGPGHILFFTDKLRYLAKRHERLKKEMRRRGFSPTKRIDLDEYPANLRNDWRPRPEDYAVIKERLAWKLRQKPGWYRYEGEPRPVAFFLTTLDGS